jgi:DNA-binding FadR family transcriptional regulator
MLAASSEPSDQLPSTFTTSYEHFIEADTEFHVGIARLSRNRLLVRAVTEVRCQMERIMFAAIDIGYYGELPAREHNDIVEAIRRRDPRAATPGHALTISIKEKVMLLAAGSPARPI